MLVFSVVFDYARNFFNVGISGSAVFWVGSLGDSGRILGRVIC